MNHGPGSRLRRVGGLVDGHTRLGDCMQGGGLEDVRFATTVIRVVDALGPVLVEHFCFLPITLS